MHHVSFPCLAGCGAPALVSRDASLTRTVSRLALILRQRQGGAGPARATGDARGEPAPARRLGRAREAGEATQSRSGGSRQRHGGKRGQRQDTDNPWPPRLSRRREASLWRRMAPRLSSWSRAPCRYVARRAPSPVSVTAASLAAPVSPTRPSLVDLGYFGPGTGTWTGACRVGVPTACLRVARRRRRHIEAACEHAASLRGRRRGWRGRDGGGGGGGGGERRHGARRPRRRLGPCCLPIRQSGAAHDSQKIRIRSLRIRSFKCCGPQVRCGARDEMTPLESVRPLALFKARVARRLCAPSLAVWQRGGLGARISTRHTRLSCPWRLGCQHATDITQTHQTLLPACSRWIASTSLLRGVSA